jgi:hypothetical protein
VKHAVEGPPTSLPSVPVSVEIAEQKKFIEIKGHEEKRKKRKKREDRGIYKNPGEANHMVELHDCLIRMGRLALVYHMRWGFPCELSHWFR